MGGSCFCLVILYSFVLMCKCRKNVITDGTLDLEAAEPEAAIEAAEPEPEGFEIPQAPISCFSLFSDESENSEEEI